MIDSIPPNTTRAAVGWHDVAARLTGRTVADVAEHFRIRPDELTRDDIGPGGYTDSADRPHELQTVRTVLERVYRGLSWGDVRILASYVRALRSARRLIYVENQFLWSPEIAEILRDKLLRPPSDGFRLLAILPAKPNHGGDDTRGVLAELVEADAGAGRLVVCTLYARAGHLADPVYVHAKVGMVDDACLTIGSAKLNERSPFNDTEMNVVTGDDQLVRQTRLRLWSEHLELPLEQVAGDPRTVIDQLWKPISAEHLERRSAG